MKFIKNIILGLAVFITTITILSIVYTILINMHIVSNDIDNVKKYALGIGTIGFFFLGLTGGLNSNQKAIFIGLIYGCIALIIMYIMSFFNIVSFNITNYVKIIIYLSSCILGAVLSKNKKSSQND